MSGARKSQRAALRVEAREEGFGLGGRGKVVDLACRYFRTGGEDGLGEGREKVSFSEALRDCVGEGGRNMFVGVCGVCLSQGMVSRNLVGEDGGVRSKVEKGSCS